MYTAYWGEYIVESVSSGIKTCPSATLFVRNPTLDQTYMCSATEIVLTWRNRTKWRNWHFTHHLGTSAVLWGHRQATKRLRHEKAFNPLKPELNPICYLLALVGVHHFLHVSRIRVKLLTFRRLMSYIYEAPILDVSRPHTTTQHSR